MKWLLIVVLLPLSLIAQTKNNRSPYEHPYSPKWSSTDPHGIWNVPQTPLEFFYQETFGHLIWKHYKVQYSPLLGRNLYCNVQNMTHTLPWYFDHDPKNLVLTSTSFEFDAVSGDLIAWKVWSR
jgi:hypothetical protein